MIFNYNDITSCPLSRFAESLGFNFKGGYAEIWGRDSSIQVVSYNYSPLHSSMNEFPSSSGSFGTYGFLAKYLQNNI